MRGIFRCAIAAGIMIPAGLGQSLFDQASFRSMSVGGVRLYGVSVYAGYTTSAYPGGFGQPTLAGGLGPDVDYGASTSVGWQSHGQRTNLGLYYSLSYGGLVRNSEANAFSQSLSFSLSRSLSQKWTLSLSAAGSDSTAIQYLYQPTNVAVLSQIPATLDDLAAAFSLGQFSSNQVASMLTGAPMLESPTRTVLLGTRVLSYSAQASLNYAHSSRLSFHISSFTAGGQHRDGGNSQNSGENYVMPHTVGVNAGVSMSYMLSPRTQLGLGVEESRTINRYQNGYVTSYGGSIGRKMSARWFLSVHAGGSYAHMKQQTYGIPQTNTVVAGASIGFRTYQHTLIASVERSGSDPFGFATGVNTSLNAGWNWQRPGSRWSLFAGLSQQQTRNTGYLTLSGWQASGGIAQRLNSNMQMSVQYAYLNSSGDYLGTLTKVGAHSVRASLSWTPAPVIR